MNRCCIRSLRIKLRESQNTEHKPDLITASKCTSPGRQMVSKLEMVSGDNGTVSGNSSNNHNSQ